MNKFELKRGVNEKEREVVLAGLREYNIDKIRFAREKEAEVVNFTLRDENNAIVAAIMSRIYGWSVMEISVVWVHKDFRNLGLGKQLMEKIESIAHEKSCTLIHLNTFDFQAPEFYKKLGYSVFAELKNCPAAGHTTYYFKKDL